MRVLISCHLFMVTHIYEMKRDHHKDLSVLFTLCIFCFSKMKSKQ